MPTFQYVALKYDALYEYFSDFLLSKNDVERAMAISACKVIEYQMSLNSTVTETHFIACLCDPLTKDDATKLSKFWKGPQEVGKIDFF